MTKANWIEPEFYAQIMEAMPICTVDVLLFNSEKTHTLLFKRTNEPIKGQYFSIGGRLLKNESFEEGAVRQAKKEIGVMLEKEELVFGGVINEIHNNSAFTGINYHSVNICFGVILSNTPKIIFDGQHTAKKWVPINDPTLHSLLQERLLLLLPKL